MLRERCRFSLASVGQVLFAVGGSGGSSDDLEYFDADGHQVFIHSFIHSCANINSFLTGRGGRVVSVIAWQSSKTAILRRPRFESHSCDYMVRLPLSLIKLILMEPLYSLTANGVQYRVV